jgi:uncharacterized protein YecE (DUF72 family)
MTIHVGTSGWHYKSWVGRYYPAGLPAEEMLTFCAREFSTVEIDSSFYRLPADTTLRRWADNTPPGFTFAYKASRYLTHWRKLGNAKEPLVRILQNARLLGPKLGPLLFQLPPRWQVNVDRLESFLDLLPAGGRHVFEFRDKSWFTVPVCEALRKHGAGLCIYEFGDFRSPLEVTAEFVYVRLHGPAGPYAGLYDEAALSFWAEQLQRWESEGLDSYCYFDNDERGYAVQNARELSRMLMAAPPEM